MSRYKKSTLNIKTKKKNKKFENEDRKRYTKHYKAGITILILDKTDLETGNIVSNVTKFESMNLY